MCGINGILALTNAERPCDRAELIRTRDHMHARGPDGQGEWMSSDHRVGFGHRRLSIIDLSNNAAQPMVSEDGRYVVTFNGEIYNHVALRQQLEAKGHRFRTTSDTEVLLHLFAAKREDMVHDLRGMFAFAIWDGAEKRLFLARDAFGIKPLYYSLFGHTFRFASQVKALLHGQQIPDDVDVAGLVGFHLFGSVPEPFTISRHIRALPAGHWLHIDAAGTVETRCYHSIADAYGNAERSGDARGHDDTHRMELARAALLDSVRHHLVSDVPVGAFLSGGIDSGALVGLMRDAGQSDIETVTLAFEEFEGSSNDESLVAADVARTYGTRHTRRVIRKSEFLEDQDRILAAMDQPSIDGINSWFVAKAARECGLKVAISGVGGDELLGGYPSFRDIPRCVRTFGWPAAIPGLGTLLRRGIGAVAPLRRRLRPKTASLVEFGGTYAGAWFLRRGLYMPWELDDVLDPDVAREGLERLKPLAIVQAALEPMPASSFARVATLEASLYMRNQLLRDTDWASMAHSLEVRTPLVDVKLLDTMAALGPPDPAAMAKRELALAPRTPLPAAVTGRKKTGFGVPMTTWMGMGAGTGPSTYAYSRDWARQVWRMQSNRAVPQKAWA